MKYKKQAIVIVSMAAGIVLIQCSKSFEKTNADSGTMTEKQSAEKKK